MRYFSPEGLEDAARRVADWEDVSDGDFAALAAFLASAGLTAEHTHALHRGLRGHLTASQEANLLVGIAVGIHWLEAELPPPDGE